MAKYEKTERLEKVPMEYLWEGLVLSDNLYNYKGLFLIFVGFIVSGFLGVALYENLVFRMAITLAVLGLLIVNRNKFLGALKQIRGK